MKFLVTGANGVLGTEVVKAASTIGECRACTIKDIDVAQTHQIADVLFKYRPNIVINCAGLVKYRPVADSQYVRINSLAPQIIAERCDWYNIKFVHVSTDCVFSGLDGRAPYSEKSEPNPQDVYAKSKLAGEVIRNPHLTVRSSFIGYGERGLLSWLLRQKEKIVGYDQAFWSGVTASVLARTLIKLAINDATGLVHVYGETVSKYDLLCKLNKLYHLELNIACGPTPEHHRVNRSLTTVTKWSPEELGISNLDWMLNELYEARSDNNCGNNSDRP